MLRTFIVMGALLGAVLVPLTTRAAATVELKSVSVALPDSDRTFTPGPGSDAVTNNCLACHSVGMVLNQPALSREAWIAEVNKMITAYKAPIPPEDVDVIVDYLTNLQGAK
jgi:mono/diheme cytochrome c family protein